MIVADGGIFPPGVDLDLTVSPETARRVAGMPASSLTSERYSGGVVLFLAVLGVLAVGGALLMARDG